MTKPWQLEILARRVFLTFVGCAASVSGQAGAQRAVATAFAPAAVANAYDPGLAGRSEKFTKREILGTALISTVTAVPVGLLGGALGSAAGYGSCVREYGPSPGTRLLAGAVCFGNDGLIYGAYIGTLAGAALGAAGGGIRAGCARRQSFTRAFLGSLAGSIPSIVYVASGRSDRADQTFAVATPVLQIAGATAAVSRCRVAPRA